ncbi:hypothetical protein RF11_01158 [Thelohanellus kitauei]|uniref:Uncharacterized protein n=1 Tax=Thelohanellus kitauei TaxID=669202 RepID=A0A0C2NID3_THEKT|nr:hypothetical protein RF11_01158 [Thelohanellus kitauei]
MMSHEFLPGLPIPGMGGPGQAQPPKKEKEPVLFGACRKKIKSAIKNVCLDPFYHKITNEYVTLTKCVQRRIAIKKRLPDATVVYNCCLIAFDRDEEICERNMNRFIYCMLRYQIQLLKTAHMFLKGVSPFELEYNDPSVTNTGSDPYDVFLSWWQDDETLNGQPNRLRSMPRLHSNLILVTPQPYAPPPPPQFS